MAMERELNQRVIEGEEVGGAGCEHDGPVHHPSPPPDELFDISTTVDPGYIISLIRKLIPVDAKNGETFHRFDAAHGQPKGADDIEGYMSSSAEEARESSHNEPEGMDIVSDPLSKEEDTCQENEQNGKSATEERWEEYGCILWDLAAGRTHAELMVENLILEVLRVNIMVSPSPRVTEICLGIIGNLVCHAVPLNHIESTSGMIDIIVEQLYLDDTQCLNEVCRILTSGLHGTGSTLWVKSLQSEQILRRILWIMENTLNPQLLEKSVGLILTTIEGQAKMGSELLSCLMSLGLASLLINLLSFEMDKLMTERTTERYAVLDAILSAIEALSVLDDHSQEICSNRELFQLICCLIKIPNKAEVATACVTAGVLLANMMSDQAKLSSDLLQDIPILQGMFDVLPYASDDMEAKRAIWSVIARLLVTDAEINFSSLHQYVLVLVSKYELIEDDLLDHQFEESNKKSERLNSRLMAIRNIVSLLNRWKESGDNVEEKIIKDEIHASDADVEKLLDCCSKYIESNART